MSEASDCKVSNCGKYNLD